MIRSQLPEQEVPTAAQDHIEGAKVAVKFDLPPQPPADSDNSWWVRPVWSFVVKFTILPSNFNETTK